MNENETLGGRLKSAREEKRLTQKSLAEKLGVSILVISHYENDRATPSTELLMRLGKELDKSVIWLWKGEESDNEETQGESSMKFLEVRTAEELFIMERIFSLAMTKMEELSEKEYSIGQNIKKARIEKKLTQKELADKIRISRQALSHYETGDVEPSMDIVLELSEALDISYECILENLTYSNSRKVLLEKIKKIFENATKQDLELMQKNISYCDEILHSFIQ